MSAFFRPSRQIAIGMELICPFIYQTISAIPPPPPPMYATVLNTLVNALQCDIIANSDTAAPLAQCIARQPAAVVNCDLNTANGFFSARKTSTEMAMPAIPTKPNCRAQTMSLSSSANLHPPPPPPPPRRPPVNWHGKWAFIHRNS